MDFTKYTSKIVVPSKPAMPADLRKTASMMSGPQIAALPTIKSEYEGALAAWNRAVESRQYDDQRLYNEFRNDLAIENGMEYHPKKDKLFELAWEFGHSAGYAEVASYYERLVGLLK